MALSEAGYGLLPVVDVPQDRLDAFTCGNDKANLATYLREQARAAHLSLLSHTTVVFHKDDQHGVVGYFTLSNDSLPLNSSEKFELGLSEVELTSFPAIKLGRFAVREDLQSSGVGSAIVSLVVGQILSTQKLSAARLLVVDADSDERVLRFYERNGFQRSLWAEKKAVAAAAGGRQKGQARAAAEQGAPASTVKMLRDILPSP